MAAEEKGDPGSSFSPAEQEHLHHLQLDLNDLDEKLSRLKKRQEKGPSEEARKDNERIISETEARIAAKKLEMAKIRAVKNMAEGDEDSNAPTDAGSAGPPQLHHSREILKHCTVRQFFARFHEHENGVGTPPYNAAQTLLSLTQQCLKINDEFVESPPPDGIAPLTIKMVYDKKLEDSIQLAHPMRLIFCLGTFDSSDEQEVTNARTLIFGDGDFLNPVIEAGSSNASKGDHSKTHLQNDWKDWHELARLALRLEQEGTPQQLAQQAKPSTHCLSKTKTAAMQNAVTLRNGTVHEPFDKEAFSEIIAENNRQQTGAHSTSGFHTENAKSLEDSLRKSSTVNSAVALRNVFTRSLSGCLSKTHGTASHGGRTSALYRKGIVESQQGAGRESAGIFGQSPDPIETRGNLTHRAIQPHSPWTCGWVSHFSSHFADALSHDLIAFPSNYVSEILNHRQAEHEVYLRLREIVLVTHGRGGGSGTTATNASAAFSAKAQQTCLDLDRTDKFSFDDRSLACAYGLALDQEQIESTLELQSSKHAATYLLNYVEDFCASVDFKDDTYALIAAIYSLRFFMLGSSPALTVQAGLNDYAKIAYGKITANASAEASEQHTCLSQEILLHKFKLEMAFFRTQNLSHTASVRILDKALAMLEQYEENVREKRWDKLKEEPLVLNNFLLLFQAESTALQELNSSGKTLDQIQEELNGTTIATYLGTSSPPKGGNGKGKGKGKGGRKNQGDPNPNPQRKEVTDAERQSLASDPALRSTGDREIETDPQFADFKKHCESAMHLLAFMRQMSKDTNTGVAKVLDNMPDVLEMLEMISLAHSKGKYVTQLRAQQQELKKNPKGSNGKGRTRAQHAITMKLGPLDRGLFVRLDGGFEGQQYEMLTKAWEKATSDGDFDFCTVGTIFAFLRRSTIILSSASFPKDPPQGARRTKQKTQSTAQSDFALQLDAVSASKNGQRLFGSAHALFVAAFVSKEQGPPQPQRSMVAQPQPQQPQPPQHLHVYVYEDGSSVQYISGRGWVPLAPVEPQRVPQFSNLSSGAFSADDSKSDNNDSPLVPEYEQPPHLHGGGTGGMQMLSQQRVPMQQQWPPPQPQPQPQVTYAEQQPGRTSTMAGTLDGSVNGPAAAGH